MCVCVFLHTTKRYLALNKCVALQLWLRHKMVEHYVLIGKHESRVVVIVIIIFIIIIVVGEMRGVLVFFDLSEVL